MADFAYSRSEMDAAEELNSGNLQSMIHFLGGLVSIVLIAGLVAWGWQLLVRDVSGVPVVQALVGPMRVVPDEPGGAQAAHQGLAVNQIAEGQEAAPAADQIVLAPAPVELADLTNVAPVIPQPANSVAEPVAEVALLQTPQAPAAPTPQSVAAASSALINELLNEANTGANTGANIGANTSSNTSSNSGATALRRDTVSISVAGVRSSLVPAPRPVALQLAAANAAPASSPSATAPSEIDITTLSPGTRLVQLGAFDSPEDARREWGRLAAAYPDFFGPRDRIVMEAVSGGRTFFRLRAHGFADLMDARRFCTALLAEGAPCIPVTVR